MAPTTRRRHTAYSASPSTTSAGHSQPTSEPANTLGSEATEAVVRAPTAASSLTPAISPIERYLRLRATRLGRRTLECYRADLLAFAAALGTTAVFEARPDDIAAWFRSNLRDPADPTDPRPWAPRTAHRRRASLNGFYEWARRQELIVRNPVDEVELPRFERPAPVVIGVEPLERLFAYVEDRITTADYRIAQLYILDAAVLRLMEHLALRVSEASGVRVSQVRTVSTAAGLEVQARVMKKGNRSKVYPLTGVVLDAYLRWLRTRQWVTPCPGHEDFLFLHPWTGYRVSRQRAWQRLKRIASEAGVPEETVAVLSPHKLRHSRARRMLDAGWNLAAVQAVLDHTNIATTSVYLEHDEQTRLHALRAQSQLDARYVERSTHGR